jgi:soluble lytic murein transglycosylase-like protein
MATVMQIESCGHPTINSSAGAQGLFQVMPFHFTQGEDMLEPETNARRGLTYLKYCVDSNHGDIGQTLGCYNGGPSVNQIPFNQWRSETQRYYYWGTGIYEAATSHAESSARLDEWLQAGGGKLCAMASHALGM